MENKRDFEEGKNQWKTFLGGIFVLVVGILLVGYWFIPFDVVEFGISSPNSNFSLNSSVLMKMQFYENMRYASPQISYKIYDCPLQKKNEMERAFEILGNRTILEFYPLGSDEEISVTCDSGVKIDNGMFIAGEGGPVNITKTKNFNVILNGKVLLIRESECATPNIALHELLHALGFGHSENKNNIMYNVTSCRQTLGEDIPVLIDELYSVASLPDLNFENVSALMEGRYLNANFSVRNNGLRSSGIFSVEIFADGKEIKNFEFEEIEIGYGRVVEVQNILINQISVEEITFSIETDFEELDKNDNKVILKIKK